MTAPLASVSSTAPLRICDNGGWTDTWFAGHGRVFNIGVAPRVEVRIVATPRRDRAAPQVHINAVDYGDHYAVVPGRGWGKHPLLEAAIQYVGVPEHLSVEVSIRSGVPGGASTGTSAAVTVALIGALDALTPGRMTPHEVAEGAHRVETDLLHRQSGIQDQLCAAYGGINDIEMDRYPHATVSPVVVPDVVWSELDRRLLLIYLGVSHESSRVHEMVIRRLEKAGPTARPLEDLRLTASRSCEAVRAGDLAGLGQAMIDNTEAQRRLHPALVGPRHQRVIDLALGHGAVGWKVNGAGGDGGSVTILSGPDAKAAAAMIEEIEREDGLKQIPIALSREGLRVSAHWSK